MHSIARAPIDVLIDELAKVWELASLSSWPDDHLARNLAECTHTTKTA
jgi:hypothetical protein